MKRMVIGVMIVGIISLFTGCSNDDVEDNSKKEMKKTMEADVFDYADYPENFMVQLEADKKYILKNGESTTDFSAMTHAKKEKDQILTYGDMTYDLSDTVYFRKTEPVLIHFNGNDYIWICEQSNNGQLIAASFFYIISEYKSYGSDNGTINITIGDKVLDPADFEMNRNIKCFGYVLSNAHYTINEKGKPEELENNDEFYYVASPYADEELCLDSDINTWVYANKDAAESTVEIIPKDTVFKRFRSTKNAEYNYVEGILEDGRVFRVVEEYWFSEPTAAQVMMDKDETHFTYSSKANKQSGFTGMKESYE